LLTCNSIRIVWQIWRDPTDPLRERPKDTRDGIRSI
jgi:hypothetical protein